MDKNFVYCVAMIAEPIEANSAFTLTNNFGESLHIIILTQKRSYLLSITNMSNAISSQIID